MPDEKKLSFMIYTAYNYYPDFKEKLSPEETDAFFDET